MFDKLVDALGKAYDLGVRITSDLDRRFVEKRIIPLAVAMSEVNNPKMMIAARLDIYFRNPTSAQWTAAQGDITRMAVQLDKLRNEVDTRAGDIIKTSGLTLKDDLGAALQRQLLLYRQLAEAAEPTPKGSVQWKQAEETAKMLHELLDRVRKMETTLSDAARTKHPRRTKKKGP